MEVVLTKTTQSTITYGNEQTVETIRLTNVTRIDYVYNLGVASYYAITHQTGDDASAHTTNFGVKDYIISIVPML